MIETNSLPFLFSTTAAFEASKFFCRLKVRESHMQRMELLRTAKLIFVFRCDMMSAQLAFFRRESFMQKGLNLTVGGGCDPLDIILSFDKIVESFEARLLKRILKSELSHRQN